MKRTGLGLLAVAALSLSLGQVALGADMRPRVAKAPPPPPPPPMIVSSWTGCYLGANIGGASANRSFREIYYSGYDDLGSHNATGFVGGGQIGCDYQFNTFVLGVRGMFDGSTQSGSHSVDNPPWGTDHYNTKVHWFGDVVGRLGFAISPSALIYAKGGWAWIRESHRLDSFSVSTTRNGWTVGGGAEWMFAPNWSVFAEYGYYNFGNKTWSGTWDTIRVKSEQHVGLVGVNFRFGAGGPFAARY
jgi:outer membrane immunogenic protein